MVETDTPPRMRGTEQHSIRDLFGSTVEHGKAYVAAEKEALTLRAKMTAGVAKNAAVFGGIAAVLALFALGWLFVALVSMLAHLIPYPLAALAMAALLFLAAYLCVRRVVAAIQSLPGVGA